jgi:cytochrome c oxidase subunit 4
VEYARTRAAHATVGHIVPVWLLAAVLAVLLILTWLTVGATKFEFGSQGNLLIALVIATIKGTLVALYFMHLRWDRPFNALVFLSSLFFVALFIWFSSMDTREYQASITDYRMSWDKNSGEPDRFAPDQKVLGE